MEFIANLMSLVFWGCLIWLIYSAVKKQDKRKPAIATAVTFVVAVILNAIANYPETKKEELSSKQTQTQSQVKEQPANKEVAKKTSRPKKPESQSPKPETKKYLADYYEIRSQILDISPRWKEENAVPVKRNGIEYKRKMIKATTSFVEFVGIPKVIEVNYMFVPSDKNWQNMESLTLLGAVSKYVCGEYDQEKNKRFIKKFSEHFVNFGDEEITYVGKCKAKLGKVDKDFPITYITFTPRD